MEAELKAQRAFFTKTVDELHERISVLEGRPVSPGRRGNPIEIEDDEEEVVVRAPSPVGTDWSVDPNNLPTVPCDGIRTEEVVEGEEGRAVVIEEVEGNGEGEEEEDLGSEAEWEEGPEERVFSSRGPTPGPVETGPRAVRSAGPPVRVPPPAYSE